MIVQDRDFFHEHWFKILLNTFEKTTDSVVLTTPSPDEHFLYVNQAFKDKTGYAEAELVGKSPRILQGIETNLHILQRLKEHLANDQDFVGQNINYRKNGTPYIVHWHISAIKNSNHEIVAYISYQKEITQSIWKNNQLNLLSSIIDHTDQMIAVTNLTGEMVYINSSFLNKYGYKKDEIINKSINILKSGEMNQSFYRELWSTILSGRSFHGVFINKHKNGEKIIEKKTITPIKDGNADINFFASISQDITELINESNEYKNKYFIDPLTGLQNRIKLKKSIEEKIRKAVEQNLCVNDYFITASLGVTQISPNDTKETLFKRTDQALYESKNNGKNRVSLIE